MKSLFVEYFKLVFLLFMTISYFVIFGVMFNYRDNLHDLFIPFQVFLSFGFASFVYLTVVRFYKIKKIKKQSSMIEADVLINDSNINML